MSDFKVDVIQVQETTPKVSLIIDDCLKLGDWNFSISYPDRPQNRGARIVLSGGKDLMATLDLGNPKPASLDWVPPSVDKLTIDSVQADLVTICTAILETIKNKGYLKPI